MFIDSDCESMFVVVEFTSVNVALTAATLNIYHAVASVYFGHFA